MLQVPVNEMPMEEALRWARLGAGSFLHALVPVYYRLLLDRLRKIGFVFEKPAFVK